MDIINSGHPSIHGTLKIIKLDVTVRNQIRASYVHQRITESLIVQNRKSRKINLTGTQKILNLVHTYLQK